ncbi:MAG: 50S ribosomal protein L30 [candidate division WOR-3 bacterium]|nr:50S ribosomal protein L30 [candidate division WOR-3 bacterium]
MKKIKVTLVKSLIDTKPVHKKNAWALGLKRLNSYKIHEDTPVIRGMIRRVKHLVKVEYVD